MEHLPNACVRADVSYECIRVDVCTECVGADGCNKYMVVPMGVTRVLKVDVPDSVSQLVCTECAAADVCNECVSELMVVMSQS